MSVGREIAAELTLTLSAPECSSADEEGFCRATNHIKGGFSPLDGGGDVEECDLISTLCAIPRGELDGVALIDKVLKINTLDDPAGVDVETGNDADRERH